MQIFKTFFKIAFRSFTNCIFYLAIFTGLSFGLAGTQSASSQTPGDYQPTAVNIAVIDYDQSPVSTALYDYLDAHEKRVEISDDPNVWADELFYHTVEYILVIQEGFADAFAAGDTADYLLAYENPSSNQSYIISSLIDGYLDSIRFYQAAGYETAEAIAKAGETADLSVTVNFPSVDTQSADTTESENTRTGTGATAMSYFFRYVPYMMICVLINSMGPMLVIWNRPEIKTRTSVSGLSARSRNSAMIAACLTFSATIFVILSVVAAVVYRTEFTHTRTIYYLLNTFCYLLVSSAITFTVAQLSKQIPILNMWSNVIGLSTSFLCGIFVARDLLPDGVVSFSKCLPTYWYVNVTEELTYFDGSISRLAWQSMGIQILFAAAFFVIGLVIIRARRQQFD